MRYGIAAAEPRSCLCGVAALRTPLPPQIPGAATAANPRGRSHSTNGRCRHHNSSSLPSKFLASSTHVGTMLLNIRGVDDVQDHLVHAMEQSHLLDELQIEERREYLKLISSCEHQGLFSGNMW
ncbi:uncharacterized protein LOC125543926 isoform X1 [Triticum urartu]|uniref:uncharacterized protein LOC125543926 isoform X1 n=1 Tax=Triticum urartu TaxID=4572 RepID=UPI0020431CCC|nr:uncharacterized protein LOC125543926 isoform X1 [Triticum urartu]